MAGLAAALLCCEKAPPPAASVPPPETPAAAQASPTPPQPAEAPPTPPAPAAPPPASPPPPVELVEAQALVPGAATALRPGEQITVDPGATFRVVLKGTFPEARLSLLDGADAMLPSAGGREAGPSTTVTLQPAAPLRPGAAYRLRLDGATTRELKAADGTLRAPVELPILAAGEPPPEPKAKAKRPKKRP